MSKKKSDIHIMPLNDYIEHIETPFCNCNPKENNQPDMKVTVWVHNRFGEIPQ